MSTTTGDRVTIGDVSRDEHDLMCRGLENLRKTLLDEAGSFAVQELQRKSGAFAHAAQEGRKRLAEIKTLNALHAKLKALVRDPNDTSEGDPTS